VESPEIIPKILIVGAGAVGGFYGGKLSQAGAEVSVVCRSNYEAVRNRGIVIRSGTGDFEFKPKYVLRYSEEYPETPDYVIITTKALPEIPLASIIKPVVKSETGIVLLQNGIDIEVSIAHEYPKHDLISVLAFIGVSQIEHGIIWHQDYGRVELGLYPKGISKKTRVLLDLFSKAGIEATVTETIMASRWKKLVWNAPFNPLSVLAGGVETHTLLSDPHTRELIKRVMTEVVALARHDGYILPSEIIKKNIEVTEKMPSYKTSMLLDYEARRPMEVEAILGNAIKKAEQFGVPTPYLYALYSLLKLVNQHFKKTLFF